MDDNKGNSGASLQHIKWMLEDSVEDVKDFIPAYGDLSLLNKNGIILNAIGKKQLRSIVSDYLEMLETSAAVYEKNGDYALGIFSSGWCQMMDAASRNICETDDNTEALKCGKWLCHDSCWKDAALKSMTDDAVVDIKCAGGLSLYTVPVKANGDIIGAINFGYGAPPTDENELKSLSEKYKIPLDEIKKQALNYKSRPKFIVDLAKRRLKRSAAYIGSIVEGKLWVNATDEANENLRITLNSIGDGVITTDVNGLITKMNPVAEKMTGWLEADALGLPLKTCFKIIGETTREVVEDPAEKVIREGHIVGMANHTVLIAKDGSELPISDSGAPIRNNAGEITGVIVVFSDQSEERMLQKIQNIRIALFEYAHSNSLNKLLVKTLDEVETITRSSIGFYHFIHPDQQSLDLKAWSTSTREYFSFIPQNEFDFKLIETGLWMDCIRKKKPIVHNNTQSITRLKDTPKGHKGIFRELVVPVFRKGKIVAVLGVGNKSSNYTEKDIETVNNLADVCWEIVEKKRSEEQLHESNRKFNAMINNLNGVVYRCAYNKEWTMLYLSDAIFALSGYKPEELINNYKRSYNSIIFPDDRAYVAEFVSKSLKANEQFTLEYRIVRADKQIRWVWERGRSVRGLDEEMILEGYLQDITDRKMAEQKLKFSEQNLNLAQTIGKLGSWQFNLNSGEVTASNEALLIYGLDPNLRFSIPDVQKMPLKSYRPMLDKALKDLVESGSEYNLEFELKHGKTGEIRTVHSMAEYNSVDNTVTGTIQDITAQKRIEASLKESERRYRTLFNQAADGILVGVESGEIIDANESICSLTGYTKEELIGSNITLLFAEADLKNNPLRYDQVKKGANVIRERRITRKDGSVLNVEMNTKILEDGRMQALFRDISQRIEADRYIRLLSRSVEQSPVNIVITDSLGNIEYVNPSFTKLTGYTFEEAVGLNPRILNSGYQNKGFFKNLWDTILSGRDWHGEFRNKKKNGEFYWEDAVISPIMDDEGKIAHFVAVKEDVTDKRSMIKELVSAKNKAEESDRLKSAFLANMSHEIRTPMNGILGFLDLMQVPELSLEERMGYLDIVKKSGDRLLKTINDIIEISKIESGLTEIQVENVNLNDVLNYFHLFFKPEAEKKSLSFQLKTSLPSENFTIRTDKNKLESIVVNFIKNALKFTATGFVEIGATVKDGRFLFYVQDSGIGIPQDRQEAVFDRFIQADMGLTRPHDGSGLGLSICKAYAELLGGSVGLESVYGRGSKFYLSIPVVLSREHLKIETAKLNLTSDGNNRIILIAEDEDNSFMFIQILLTGENFRVMRARNGAEAVKYVYENPEISLVLMDLKMPEMDGYTATREIRKFNNNIPVIAQTAYALAGDSKLAFVAGCNDYLTKPIKKEELMDCISRNI